MGAIDKLLNGRPLVVVDAGARDGFGLLRPLHRFIELYAFEPHAASYTHLRCWYAHARFGKAVVSDSALASHSGTARFHNATHPSLSSLLKPDLSGYHQHVARMEDSAAWIENLKTCEISEVRTETLERWAQDHDVGFIDFLKLDTQGSELEILRGAGELLRSGNVGLVYAEVSFIPLYEGQCSFAEVEQWMHQCGYRLAGVNMPIPPPSAARQGPHGRPLESPRTGFSADVLYVPGSADSCRQPASAALLLSALGYFSLAEHFIKTRGLLDEQETDLLFREFSRLSFGGRTKRLLRRLAPPLLQEWFSRLKQ